MTEAGISNGQSLTNTSTTALIMTFMIPPQNKWLSSIINIYRSWQKNEIKKGLFPYGIAPFGRRCCSTIVKFLKFHNGYGLPGRFQDDQPPLPLHAQCTERLL